MQVWALICHSVIREINKGDDLFGTVNGRVKNVSFLVCVFARLRLYLPIEYPATSKTQVLLLSTFVSLCTKICIYNLMEYV